MIAASRLLLVRCVQRGLQASDVRLEIETPAMSDDSFPRLMSLAVHELRTPVTVVAGYLRMLLKEQAGPVNEKQRKMLDEASKSCARISAIVDEMSELGKIEAGTIPFNSQPVELVQLMVELASGMHEGDDRGVHVEVRGEPGPVMVAADRQRLSAALRALMHAAVRERGQPGAVIVECSVLADASPPSALVAIGDEGTVRSLVEEARNTPLPFNEWLGGLGLILPISRRVIERHGGALWSATSDKQCAASALRLPIAAGG